MNKKNLLENQVTRLIVITFLIISFLAIIAQIRLQSIRKNNYIDDTKIFLKTIIKLNNKDLSNELFEQRNVAVKIRAEALLKIKMIKAIEVFNNEKKVIYSSKHLKDNFVFPTHRSFKVVRIKGIQYLRYISTIGYDSKNFGYFIIYYSLDKINHEKFISYLFFSIFIIFILLFLSFFQQNYLKKTIILPLNKLKNAMHLISSENKVGTTIKIGGNDEIEDLANSFNDMSLALKKSYEEVFQSKERFHVIFNQTFQLIALLDIEGNLLEANQTGLNFIGAKTNIYEGLPFWQTPWWKYSDEQRDLLKRSIPKVKKGEFVRFEAYYPSENGKIYIDFSLKPVYNKDGKVYQIIAEGRDITERKKAEAQLSQAQKMEMVGTLAGGLAHDFNNLLSAILGSISLIKMKRKYNKNFIYEDFDNYISVIEKSGERATNLVNQLLTISRKQELVFTELDLNYSVKNVIKFTKSSLDKSVSFDFDFGEPAIIKADPTQMEQVLLNLCVNAAHSMTIMRQDEKWGGKVFIKIDKFSPDKSFLIEHPEMKKIDYLRLSIKDQGVGIEEKYLEKIFNPFFTTKDKGKGTGLGLSMVYNIIKQHSGFIYVDSKKGVGTEFKIYFPEINNHYKRKKVEHSKDYEIQKGEGLILIIDDEEILRVTAESILAELGYISILAENGKEGINIYSQKKDEISLILLDMVMPVMSGKETFIKLKKINPNCKIILSSGFKQDERVQEIIKMGVDYFLQKPYDFSGLSTALSNVLNS